MTEPAIKISHVSKEYRLGTIGGGTLRAELQSKFARMRGKEDPNLKIGAKAHEKNEHFLALDDVSLEINKGERVGIIGHNGAGKSTLLKLICRVTAPTKGDIYMKGRVTSMLEVGTGFHGELTGRENVYLNGAILGLSKSEIDAKFDEIVEFSEVGQFIDTPVKRYSSGMHVKLGFSVASHLDSEIMIMDEVLAVGDVSFQNKCIKRMREVAEEEGRTILYVSHNMNTVRNLCDRCIVLEHGKVVYDGEVENGISKYLIANDNEFKSFYDFKDTRRPSSQHGKKVFIDSFEFLDHDIPTFDRNEKMEFEIKYSVNDDIKALRLYTIVYTEQGIPVGMTQTFEPIRNVEKENNYSDRFIFDISNIVSGKYYLQIDLYAIDDNGNHFSYDHPTDNINFEIIDSKPMGIKWEARYYGYIALKPISIE